MIPLLLFVVNLSQKQINDNPFILDGTGSRYASEYILFATASGIYTFDRSGRTWKTITTAHGLPANSVDLLGIDQGILWACAGPVIASADIRLNDWQSYNMDGAVNGIGFDDNYVWVAGDFGMKRFDKYVESWEDLDTALTRDILCDQDYVWAATPHGIRRYDIAFERFDDMPAAPPLDYYFIIATRSRIWFVSTDALVAYERNTGSWTEHPALAMKDYATMGDSLFVLSDTVVFLFDPKTNSWGPVTDIDDLGRVNGIAANQQSSRNILFATDQGIVVYDPAGKTRIIYNEANGMLDDSVGDVHESDGNIFAVNAERLQYFDAERSIWHAEELTEVKGTGAKILRYDEAGLHLRKTEAMDIRVEGRAYYSASGTMTDSLTWTDYSTINLRLIAQHASARTFSVYYDDTDKEDTLYGFGYRGLDTDVVHRLNGGFIGSEYYEFDLVPEHSMLGANARMRLREHDLMLQAGELKSSRESDFFFGRSFEKQDSVRDTEYQKNVFYTIPDAYIVARGAADTVFLDDRIALTNGIDTRTGYTVGGITGDFDVLINGLDYNIDYENGILQLAAPAGDDHIVVLRSGFAEIVLQSDSIRDNAVVNIYMLGPDMIPGSLELRITDTLGATHPLAEFGIDDDGDGMVDPAFVSHRLGTITFPEDRPFPQEVYTQGIHVYAMHYRFRTRSVFYTLSRRPVLVGSEKVFVDGEEMVRNYHYNIDYTTGNILFLSDETVSDYSDVEVHYAAVERTRSDLLYSVQPNIRVSDNMNLAPGYTNVAGENIFHLSGKYQAGQDTKSIIFVPQVAISEDKEHGQDHRLVANYGMFTINANYRDFSAGYESFGMSEKRYGDIRRSGSVSMRVEPFAYVRLGADMDKEYLVDSLGDRVETEYLSGKIEYLKPGMPNGLFLISRNQVPDKRNVRFQGRANYSFELSGNRVALAASGRSDLLDLAEGDERRVFDYTANVNVALRMPVRLDLYTHETALRGDVDLETYKSETRIALSIDALPGLYYTGDFQQRKETFFLTGSKDLSIQNHLFNNLNIAPGRWYAPLSIVNFALGTGQNFDEHLGNVATESELPSIMLWPVERDIETLSDLRNVYAKAYLNPFTGLDIQLKRTVTRSGNGRYDGPILRRVHSDEVRVDYKQERIGFLTATYTRTESQLYPLQVTTNAYLEWSRPWSAALRTRLSANRRTDADDYLTAQTLDTESTIKAEALLRFGRRSYVNASIGTRRQETYAGGVSTSILPGCTLYLNAVEFLYVQFDYAADIVVAGSTTHSASAKITGAF